MSPPPSRCYLFEASLSNLSHVFVLLCGPRVRIAILGATKDAVERGGHQHDEAAAQHDADDQDGGIDA